MSLTTSRTRAAQQASVWQVVVARLRLCLARSDGATISFTLVLPPKMVVSTGADHLWYALMTSEHMKQIWSNVSTAMGKARERLSICKGDGAYANL